jgi:exonuclease III
VLRKGFIKYVKKAYILKDVMGSDHAPVGIDMRFK